MDINENTWNILTYTLAFHLLIYFSLSVFYYKILWEQRSCFFGHSWIPMYRMKSESYKVLNYFFFPVNNWINENKTYPLHWVLGRCFKVFKVVRFKCSCDLVSEFQLIKNWLRIIILGAQGWWKLKVVWTDLKLKQSSTLLTSLPNSNHEQTTLHQG